MSRNKLLPIGTGVSARWRGDLPHSEINAYYFITYRLADSLPREVVAGLRADYLAAKRSNPKLTLAEQTLLSGWFAQRLDELLDEGRGACDLKIREIAEVVIQTWNDFEGSRYELRAWCVMPNHVHVVARVFDGHCLASILHSWKSDTSKKANAFLGREGPFWWRESFDHCIRNEDELARTIQYVLGNPANAGLKDYPYIWCAG